MESCQRPPLFENLIKDPPSHGLQAPINDDEVERINRYVERARNLKGAYCRVAPNSSSCPRAHGTTNL